MTTYNYQQRILNSSPKPIAGAASNHLFYYPTPSNLNYNWSYGSLAGLFFALQLITGIFLAMHYTPHVEWAFASVEHIMTDVTGGYIFRYFHANGASMIFILIYAHMGRNLYFQSYLTRRVLWHTGVVIFLLMMATAFIGYVLPWGQMSFWGATVITSLVTAVPFIGEDIAYWVWGGFSINNATLTRFFSLHYLLPFLILGLIGGHLVLLHTDGSSDPMTLPATADKITFHPYYTFKDTFIFFAVFALFAALVFYSPNKLGHSDNFLPANPLVTPAHIVPEWYFTPFYAILRACPNKLGGAIGMFAAILLLFFVPYYVDARTPEALTVFAPYALPHKVLFWGFAGVFLTLMFLGTRAAAAPYVWASKVFTVLYFAYFLLAIPALAWLNVTFFAKASQTAGFSKTQRSLRFAGTPRELPQPLDTIGGRRLYSTNHRTNVFRRPAVHITPQHVEVACPVTTPKATHSFLDHLRLGFWDACRDVLRYTRSVILAVILWNLGPLQGLLAGKMNYWGYPSWSSAGYGLALLLFTLAVAVLNVFLALNILRVVRNRVGGDSPQHSSVYFSVAEVVSYGLAVLFSLAAINTLHSLVATLFWKFEIGFKQTTPYGVVSSAAQAFSNEVLELAKDTTLLNFLKCLLFVLLGGLLFGVWAAIFMGPIPTNCPQTDMMARTAAECFQDLTTKAMEIEKTSYRGDTLLRVILSSETRAAVYVVCLYFLLWVAVSGFFYLLTRPRFRKTVCIIVSVGLQAYLVFTFLYFTLHVELFWYLAHLILDLVLNTELSWYLARLILDLVLELFWHVVYFFLNLALTNELVWSVHLLCDLLLLLLQAKLPPNALWYAVQLLLLLLFIYPDLWIEDYSTCAQLQRLSALHEQQKLMLLSTYPNTKPYPAAKTVKRKARPLLTNPQSQRVSNSQNRAAVYSPHAASTTWSSGQENPYSPD